MTGEPKAREPAGSLPFGRLGAGFWVRLAGLAAVNAIAGWSLFVLLGEGSWGFASGVAVGGAVINWVYLHPRAFPLRWLVPGLVFLTLFFIYPIVYTFYIALTNWSVPNFLTKGQAVERLESREVLPSEEGQAFSLHVYRSEDDELRFLLVSDQARYLGEPRLRLDLPPEEPILDDLDAYEVIDEDGDGVPDRIGPFRRLEARELFGIASRLEQLVLDVPDRGVAQVITISTARLAEPRYAYDPERDLLVDRLEQVECSPERGNFVCPDGRVLTPGWRVTVGLENFARVAGEPRIRGPFLRVFTWNVVFAFLSVALTLGLGLALALTFQDDRMRGRRLYRSLLILPYAVPAFLSVLVWRGLLNAQYGPVNRFLGPLFELLGTSSIPWLTDGFWAKVAVLLVNLWLGFPYMMLICMGALQAIPAELQEAARCDGASAAGVFRRVTFPLLMVSIAPLLIASFAFNFNNFVLIWLLTRGGPPLGGYAIPVGETDILISMTFNIAFASGRGAHYGLAAAITIFIFLIVVMLASFSFRYTRRLEEVYGAL